MIRRNKIRYYNGPEMRRHSGGALKTVFLTVLAALIAAFVLGLILKGTAEKSTRERLAVKSLVDFGGVEDPILKFAVFPSFSVAFLDPEGYSDSTFSSSIPKSGDAASVLLSDEEGKLHYASSVGLPARGGGSVSLSRIVSALAAKNKYSVAVFTSTAFLVTDEAGREVKKGEELALLSEITAAGFREVEIFGLPSGSELLEEVNLYLGRVKSLCGNDCALSVAIGGGEFDGTGAARLIAASEAYADGYAADFREKQGEALGKAIETSAYYLTTYSMRVVTDGSKESSEWLDSFGIGSRQTVTG